VKSTEEGDRKEKEPLELELFRSRRLAALGIDR
jgi:hypothetical protein